VTGQATTQAQQAADTHPGHYNHAPRVRLLTGDDAGGGNPIMLSATQDAEKDPHPVHGDVERAEVTQVHHGASQATITLNNQRHEDTSMPRPVSPMWKYNAFDPLCFGQHINVQFGYAIGARNRDSEETQEALMIRARVTDMTFTFPNAGGTKIILNVEDAISLLKTTAQEDRRYDNMNEIDMVREVLTRSHSGLTLANGPRENLSSTLRRVTHRKGTSYYQFITQLAGRLDYEVWVDIDEPDVLHFEKARSLTLDNCLDLVWGRDLLEFKPKFKGWDIYTHATSGGSHPTRRQALREIVNASEIDSDLHTVPGGDVPISAIEAHRMYFSREGAEDGNPKSIDTRNLDSDRIRLKATAELRRSAREFLTAEASLIGTPKLRPGIHVNIKGLYAPFDGIYYVTQSTHTIDSAGYRTRIKLRRPGMLDPFQYPFAPLRV
jgi:phage protein D